MKRILNLIATLLLVAVVGSAQPQDRQAMVTLSHEGNLTFFTDLTAFEDALEAATDGDVIYISEGILTSLSNPIEIKKRLSFVGCGYNSYIVCHVHVNFQENTADELQTPMFQGIRLRNLSFHNDDEVMEKTENIMIKNCYIDNLNSFGRASNNFYITGCHLKEADADWGASNNVVIQNSKIGALHWGNRTKLINCNLRYCNRLPLSAISSIIYEPEGDSYFPIGTPTFYNTVTKYDLPSAVYTENCYTGISGLTMDEETLEINMNPETQGWIGQDGTIVGIHGGEYPFTENPTVPTIDAANSSVEYDAANKRLNVTIKANPN